MGECSLSMFDGFRWPRGRSAVPESALPGDEYTARPRPSSNESGANQSTDKNDGVNQRVTNANDMRMGVLSKSCR
jgi:hypothetical protein